MGGNVSGGDAAPLRTALIVLDGLGDRPHPATGDRSPVEAAATPQLDALAARGALGAVTVVGPGVAPESDAGVFALLGYDPRTDSPGRGVLEALGIGMDLAPGDVAFRLNFATLDGDRNVLDPRVGRSLATADARALAEALTGAGFADDESVACEFRATIGHRGVARLHPTDGRPLSPNVSNTDPFYEREGGLGQARTPAEPRLRRAEPLDATPEAARTAAVVNRCSDGAVRVLAEQTVNARRAMAGKPIANGILLRNGGAAPTPGHPASFAQRWGRPGVAITEMPVERGIARVLGLADRFVGPMGPDRSSSLRDRARTARAALDEAPFVYLHLKGPDEPGHDGNALLKRDIIADLDASFFGPFLDGLDLTRTRIAITADHATPCILRAHADDPVPLLLAGAGVGEPGAGEPTTFSEASARRGRLGERRGSDVLPLLFGAGPI